MAENLGVKNYKWDKEDGYVVPTDRECYNSYFFKVEDETCSVLDKLELHGKDFISNLDGGSACHINLDAFPSKKQFEKIFKVAIKDGCQYFTFNIPCTICTNPECGYINKNFTDHCIKCGDKHPDYGTRVIGFLKRVSNFSEARQKEQAHRYYEKFKK